MKISTRDIKSIQLIYEMIEPDTRPDTIIDVYTISISLILWFPQLYV